jgi:opacity protein-like surface antigen
MLGLDKTIIVAALLTGTGAAPALAESGPYIGISGGVTLPQRSKERGTFTSTVPATVAPNPVYPAIASGTELGLETQFKTGFDVSGHFGYRLDNGLRLEVQVAYSRNEVKNHRNLTVGGTSIDAIDASVLTRGRSAGATVGTVIATPGVGKVSNLAALANVYYDFNREGTLQPYIGGGVGIERVDVNYAPSGIQVAQGKKTVFAYQAIAGLTYKISPGVELFTQYAYRGADRARVPLQLVPASFGVQSRQSVLSAGIRIPLGSK